MKVNLNKASHQSNSPSPSSEDQNKPNDSNKKINNFFKLADQLEDKMNSNNKNAYRVLKNEGIDKAVQFMLKHPETGEPMDYSTMRFFYG